MKTFTIKNPTIDKISSNSIKGKKIYKHDFSIIFSKKLKKEIKQHIKSDDRINLWLCNHDFDPQKNKKSDFIKFLTSCPLGKSSKKLTIHNTKITENSLPLMLKELERTICFTLKKSKEGFIIKTAKEPMWIFNQRGEFIKREEHKKVKIWLENHGILINRDKKTDIEIFLSSCPVCKIPNPLRYQRSTEKILDLQCGCISYFRLVKKSDTFVFTLRGKILKIFDSIGKDISISR